MKTPKRNLWLLLFILLSTSALAQSVPMVVQRSARPVERRETRTGVPLKLPIDPRRYVSYRGDDELINAKLRKPFPGRKVLKECAGRSIRQRKVGPAVISARSPVDVVVYNSSDPIQKERAGRWKGEVLGFIPGEDYSSGVRAAPIKSFILTSEVECLPTRIHYINKGPTQFKEFREGSAAWEEVETKSSEGQR